MHMWGRIGPRVGSGQTFFGSRTGRVNVSPGRVQEEWPVDNSDICTICFLFYVIHKIKKRNNWPWVRKLTKSILNTATELSAIIMDDG